MKEDIILSEEETVFCCDDCKRQLGEDFKIKKYFPKRLQKECVICKKKTKCRKYIVVS